MCMKRVMSHVPGFDSYTKPLFKTVHKMQFRINMMTLQRWRAETRRSCERVVRNRIRLWRNSALGLGLV